MFLNDIPAISNGIYQVNSLVFEILRILYVFLFLAFIHFLLLVVLILLTCVFLVIPMLLKKKIKILEVRTADLKRIFLKKTSNFLGGYSVYRMLGKENNFLTNYLDEHSKILHKLFKTEVKKLFI